MMVMLGTAKKLVANESPGMLAVLDQAGFDPDEMVAVSMMDGDEQQSRLTIRDGSIRVQSWTSKVKAVENALAAELARHMAERGEAIRIPHVVRIAARRQDRKSVV